MDQDDANNAAKLLGKVIQASRSEIERRWMVRVEQDIARAKDVEPTQLRDGLPDYLAELADLLQHGTDKEIQRSEAAWSAVAREHGVTRVRIGFDISQLLHEFIVLRHVIRDMLNQHRVTGNDVEAILADMLDGAISAAVRAYVDARDYEARRRHAEQIGFLTHELRNPLATATLTASHLRNHVTSEDGTRLVALLDRSHKRLGDLIDGVLLTKKMEAGAVEVRPAVVRLEQVLEPAIESARSEALDKGLSLSVDYDPDLDVEIDPLLTRSAIQNLADNAVKYTDTGRVQITVDHEGDTFQIHVRDDCHGLSREELETMFEPFKRGETGKAGTGLGLAIAKRAVEAQGGSIHAESPPPSGCHFWITLPKKPKA